MSRRRFLRTGSVILAGAGAILLPGCGGGGGGGGGTPQPATTTPTVVFRLSGRGRRVSQAAKKHNANHLFLTAAIAAANRAHAGDRSRVVQVILSGAEFDRLFKMGKRDVVDFRKL
jgi:hypothetical protein